MAKDPAAPSVDHLSGKRRWARHSRTIEVTCVGAGATVRGRTIDISRGGMLVEAYDTDIPPVGAGDLVPLAFLVAVGFANGMSAVLGPKVTVPAEVVRVTTSPLDRGFLRLGCRFRKPLTRRQCARIGIDPTDAPDPSLDLGPEHDLLVKSAAGGAGTGDRARDA